MGIIDAISKAGEIGKELASLEAKRALAEVVDQLMQAQRTIASLEAENTEMKDALAFKAKLIHRDNADWTQEGDGPFCSRCVAVLGKPVRLIVRGNGYRHCPECKDAPQTRAWDRSLDHENRMANDRYHSPEF